VFGSSGGGVIDVGLVIHGYEVCQRLTSGSGVETSVDLLGDYTRCVADLGKSRMPTMEQGIEALAKEAGVDIVGFTDKERLADAPPSGDLTYTLPSAESAIALAVAMDGEVVRSYLAKDDLWELNLVHRETYRKLKAAGIAIQGYLEYREESPGEFMRRPLSHKSVCGRGRRMDRQPPHF